MHSLIALVFARIQFDDQAKTIYWKSYKPPENEFYGFQEILDQNFGLAIYGKIFES